MSFLELLLGSSLLILLKGMNYEEARFFCQHKLDIKIRTNTNSIFKKLVFGRAVFVEIKLVVSVMCVRRLQLKKCNIKDGGRLGGSVS